MKNTPNTKFPYFLGLTALLIALCAAVFSVYGIGSLFAGASISAMIMASSLELGKLFATTFLYRYWKKSLGLIKAYLTIAVIALMLITSAGIFGFLSAAYQKSSLEFKLDQERTVSVESSKGFYTNQIQSANERIRTLNEMRKVQENRLSGALTNTILSRNPTQLQQIQQQTIKLIDQANEDLKLENIKIDQARTQILSIDEKINFMKISATEKKDIQTFKFLADALHTDLDTVAKWFIISLIFVFDPLAIALILAYNVAICKRDDENIVLETTTNKKLNLVEPKEHDVIRHTNEDFIQNEQLNVVHDEPQKTDNIVEPAEPPYDGNDFFKKMFKK